MLEGYVTPKKLTEIINKSEKWVYVGLITGKIKSVKVSRFWLIPVSEIDNIRGIVLTRKDYFVKAKKNEKNTDHSNISTDSGN